MTEIQVELPEDIDDGDWESKRRIGNVRVKVDGANCTVTFYAPIRLQQDIQNDLRSASYFFDANVVAVQRIGILELERAVQALAADGWFGKMREDTNAD